MEIWNTKVNTKLPIMNPTGRRNRPPVHGSMARNKSHQNKYYAYIYKHIHHYRHHQLNPDNGFGSKFRTVFVSQVSPQLFINSCPSAATYTYIHMHIKIYKYSRSKIVTLAVHSHLFYTSHTMRVVVFHCCEVVLAKYNSSSSRNLKSNPICGLWPKEQPQQSNKYEI